jgi:hypothetical protein
MEEIPKEFFEGGILKNGNRESDLWNDGGLSSDWLLGFEGR